MNCHGHCQLRSDTPTDVSPTSNCERLHRPTRPNIELCARRCFPPLHETVPCARASVAHTQAVSFQAVARSSLTDLRALRSVANRTHEVHCSSSQALETRTIATWFAPDRRSKMHRLCLLRSPPPTHALTWPTNTGCHHNDRATALVLVEGRRMPRSSTRATAVDLLVTFPPGREEATDLDTPPCF